MGEKVRQMLMCRRLFDFIDFIDFITHNMKALGEKGVPLQKSAAENRESASVNMAGDTGGFVYGPQYLVART